MTGPSELYDLAALEEEALLPRARDIDALAERWDAQQSVVEDFARHFLAMGIVEVDGDRLLPTRQCEELARDLAWWLYPVTEGRA